MNDIYLFLKKIVKILLPTSLLKQFEPYFRRVIFLFYIGKKHKCPICGANLSKFITLSHNDLLCPKCGSLDRDRRLWQLLSDKYLKNELKTLDFSPSRSLYRKMKSLKNINYTGSDFGQDFIADVKYDITNIPTSNNQYDLIICYHVLEHIIDDKKAMSELLRVLKPNGDCLIQTPFKAGEIYENFDIIDPKDRLIHFGQEDHVRIYAVEGLKKRLENTGFLVEVLVFNEQPNNYNGFKTIETVLIAHKK